MSENGTAAVAARLVNAAWLRALEASAALGDNPTRTLPVLVEEMALTQGEAPALIGEETSLSYRGLADAMRRVSGRARVLGFSKGDVVAVAMANGPELVATWLGLTRIGVIAALLNTNLAGEALAHCLRVANARAVIADDEHVEAVKAAADPALRVLASFSLSPSFRGEGQGEWQPQTEAFAGAPHEPVAAPHEPVAAPHESGAAPHESGAAPHESGAAPHESGAAPHESGAAPHPGPLPMPSAGAWEEGGVTLSDPALLIYTSGTTGLPKAAYVSHYRVVAWGTWFAALMDAKPEDRLYDCLPMYHSVGGVAAVGAMLSAGGSVVIAKRFSASRFWDDIVRHECTLFQYIGELCRYLVNTPPCEAEMLHKLRLCCGNGLSKDAWEAFQARFGIPRILEFYAATEGNFSLYNVEGKPGAIGRIPAYLAPRMAVEIVKVDAVTGTPLRNGNGRCLKCGPDEPGEAIARIGSSRANPASRFEGYTSAADSEKKVLRDVLEPGDQWLRSGDLMQRDKAGFFYFLDRLGDTFRWKGENVATTEVAQAIASFPGVCEVAVYGVAVPGHEGRAGMAALVVEDGFDLESLHAHITARLPAYARPLFLRHSTSLAATATFKQVKGELAREGFDPALVRDPLYFDDASSGGYVPLDAGLYAEIVGGKVRV